MKLSGLERVMCAPRAASVGELLEERYAHIMWLRCLGHGLNLAMKDFGKLKYVRTILAGANRLVNLIRNSDRLSSKLASLQQP